MRDRKLHEGCCSGGLVNYLPLDWTGDTSPSSDLVLSRHTGKRLSAQELNGCDSLAVMLGSEMERTLR